MKMNLGLILVAGVLSGSNAFAKTTFNCEGLDAKLRKSGFSLNFQTEDEVTVNTDDGSDYTLGLDGKTAFNTVYADYEYDGYGGSIALKLPKNFDSSAKVFKATLIVKTFSELGHVGTDKVKATCK